MEAPAPGEFREGHYTDDHGSRRYRLYLPSAASSGAPSGHPTGPPPEARPLIVMLHGCTQDPEDFAAGTRANAHAEDAGALVLYPEQPVTANPQKCWNWFDPAHQSRGGGEPALLAGMTRHILDEARGDPERVYVAGISAGGSMAQILAAAYPDLYRGLAVHSAPASHVASDVPTALTILQQGAADPDALPARVLEAMGEEARPVPTLVIHGTEDPMVRVLNGEQVLRQWAGVALRAGPGAEPAAAPDPAGYPAADLAADPADGCPELPGLTVESSRVDAASPATRCVYRGAPVPLEYWSVEGMGHAWSGGSDRGTYTDPAGPDATERVFRFLLSDPR